MQIAHIYLYPVQAVATMYAILVWLLPSLLINSESVLLLLVAKVVTGVVYFIAIIFYSTGFFLN